MPTPPTSSQPEEEDDNDALDQEILDTERAEEVSAIANSAILELDSDRAEEQESIELSIERQLADLERELHKE